MITSAITVTRPTAPGVAPGMALPAGPAGLTGPQGATGTASTVPGPQGPAGATGTTGATGSNGPAAWAGVTTWAASTAYSVGPPASVVTYAGGTYVCTTAHTSGASFDASKWMQVAAAGAQGVPGTAGPVGPVGPTGDITRVVAGPQPGVAYSLALSDAGEVVECTSASAVTITVALNATVAFATGTVIEVLQYGAGQITLAAVTGVTLRSPASLTSRARYSSMSLRYRGGDEWIVGGDLT